MGRAKLNMEIISSKKARQVTYEKRKKGLKKKIYELSTLCGIKACMIIYGPKLDDRSIDTEIWPTDPNEVQFVINSYKKQSIDDRKKRTVDLSNFFEDRRKKIEDSLVKQRKKNDEARYSNWDDRYNDLSEEQLRQLGDILDNKLESMKLTVEFVKGNQRLAALGVIDGSHIQQSTQNHSYFIQDLVRRSMQLEVIEQPFSSRIPCDADLPIHYLLDQSYNQGLPFDHANSMANPMMMMMMNVDNEGGDASSSKANLQAPVNELVYYDAIRYSPIMPPMPSYTQYPFMPTTSSQLHASQTDSGCDFLMKNQKLN